MCARLAARRAKAADLAALQASNERLAAALDDLPVYVAENLHWHLLVAKASENELLIAFMESIARALHTGTNVESFNSPDVRRTALRAHERITEAIVSGDADAAELRMARHTCGFKAAMLQHPDAVQDIDVRDAAAER
jgi:DNA-binding FadR family transcriptional regulator